MAGEWRIPVERLAMFVAEVAALPDRPDGRDVDAVLRWQENVREIGRRLWSEGYVAGTAYGVRFASLAPVPVSCAGLDRCGLEMWPRGDGG